MIESRFSIESISSVLFGVYIYNNENPYYHIPITANVQNALKEMLGNTNSALQSIGSKAPEMYEPSQHYAAMECLVLQRTHDLCKHIDALYKIENAPTRASALNKVSDIAFYFGIFQDTQKRKVVAIRRAAQFKGVINKKIMHFYNDQLDMVQDTVFKLDNVFDYVMTDQQVVILHPLGFEATANIQESILNAAAGVARGLKAKIPFIDFELVASYVENHKMAARLIASIQERRDIGTLSKQKFANECKKFNIEIERVDGRLFPKKGHELAFLKLLDRRLFHITLGKEEEKYEAKNRRKL